MRDLGRAVFFLALSVAIAGAAACVDEQVVFKEQPKFEQPPDTTNNYLGYFDVATKLTTCGNCHVGQQAGWVETKHASAWEDLQASGHASASCEECHTISQLGNAVVDSAGYTIVQSDRYHDVQCESCHGPGLQHVENPDATQPLAPAAVSLTATTGCGECHTGIHNPFVEEWSESPHAQIVSFAAARPECQSCHRGQGTLEAWGEDGNYIEKDSPDPLPVVCAVCHDPHDATNEGQLRFPVNTPSIEEHLCARCHNRRTVPDPSSTHGLAPHAPESALLIGDAGWFPPGAKINQGEILGTHGTDRNPRLCATCHVFGYAVSDSSGLIFNSTGHLFRPIPCVDNQGVPEPFGVNCALTVQARSFKACTSENGCHGTESAAFSALTAATTRIQARTDELHSQILQVDPDTTEAGGEIDPTDPTFTVAEGAWFNYSLATHGNSEFGTNTVVGSSVHNPFLVEALLVASIQAMQDKYGVVPTGVSRSTDWKAELQKVIARAPKAR